ncbi:MAG: DUF664 domain-containing protein [Alphaproteobacteria bacterium]|jgi:uncharacterized damage-inducible protein DinB|nr:DUF664 domain-containing protein [Alphaproteobacteria bacterium]
MARYNRWQNRNLYGAADGLDDAARRADRGAFFGSIHGTLNHILWADFAWMSRLAGWPPPSGPLDTSAEEVAGWDDLKTVRAETDDRIIAWADALTPEGLQGDLTWRSMSVQKTFTTPVWVCITHFFNHQTHHRGQVHAMLTAAGARPHDTDLPLMPGV